ncbi:hypothetical protein PF008_g31996 [Phytophthora fragariae]|uniref:Secreted protein n=1 Tax=Phytophthora fragariae TaxID=53985 RepID=A0A6G0Q115_9STRA|nr:hypothetical protein PF008_g31996 [Phytophthora fragariae]
MFCLWFAGLALVDVNRTPETCIIQCKATHCVQHCLLSSMSVGASVGYDQYASQQTLCCCMNPRFAVNTHQSIHHCVVRWC